MQGKLVFDAAIGRALLALAAMAACRHLGHAQDFAPLSQAIDSGGGEIWSSGDPAAVVGPALTPEALAPIPAAEDEFQAALSGTECAACNDGDGSFARFYNRCGCETPLFPYFTGPGNCDNWCVGPHWNVEVDGMFIHREDASWSDVGGVIDVVDQFDYGPGVRLFATGYNYSNYGVQIGYEGVNDFHSTAAIETDSGGGVFVTTNEIAYESRLNSLEVNVIRRTTVPVKVFAGVRYVEIDEEFINTTLASGNSLGAMVENRLIGFQIGGLRDAWQLNRWWTIEPYGNIGVYLNDFKREDVSFTGGVVATDKNELTQIAYLGEAGVTSVLRINACLALRAGYQVMAFDGVSNALDTSLVANGGFDPDTLLYHGARFGIEYQR